MSDEKIVELHGSDRTVVCLSCRKEFNPDEVLASLGEEFASPRCDACDGLLKTGTISFGQPMPQAAMQQAQVWSEATDVFIVDILGEMLLVRFAPFEELEQIAFSIIVASDLFEVSTVDFYRLVEGHGRHHRRVS